jgi:Zn-dependent peptidase ImmA (M78 family)/transcriptional regulator with XRE-family HTH domain
LPKIDVPVTPGVVAWAITESGYSLDEVADRVGVPTSTLAEWLQEGSEARPSLGQVRELAALLKRTPATFLLPAPPSSPPAVAQFRNRGRRKAPNPDERRYLREAVRLQRTAAWLVTELGRNVPAFPHVDLSADAERVGEDVSRRLAIADGDDAPALVGAPTSPSHAFRKWRATVEQEGALVFLLSMGADSVAGFSLWDERAPVIAINTSANHQARTFTLFHEYGHLLTRTSSLCLDSSGTRLSMPTDPAERWCEQFAAAVLLPWDRVADVLKEMGHGDTKRINDLEVAKRIASHFNVSLRAATLRLIERELATWDLYRRIPTAAEAKRPGGKPTEEGRDRTVIRWEQYGQRTIDLFMDAAERRVLSRTDVLDYLDVPDSALDRLSEA